MKITDIIQEDIASVASTADLSTMLAAVREEMEAVDDASMASQEGDANYAGLSRDYSALLAVENVIKNNLKAIKNNVMDNNIFMYDYDGDIDEIAAVHVEMQGPVAHVKWLGSYNGRGGELYRAAMQEARRRGATSVEVEAKWNSDGFYRKMGLDTTQPGEYNPFTDSQLNKMAGPLAEGKTITEYRDRMYQYIKSIVPKWPDYVVKDWLYANFATGHTTGQDAYLQRVPDSVRSKLYRYQYKPAGNPNQDLKGTLQAKQAAKNIMGPSDALANKYNWTFATIGKDLPRIINAQGLSPDTKWQLVPNMKFTMGMWIPEVVAKLDARAGGKPHPEFEIPRDAERHTTQAQLAQQQGGVRKEPVILVKRPDGYDLIEGWHRTIQHFAQYPNGYTGPAYVAVENSSLLGEETLEELTGIKGIVNKLPKPRGSRFDPLGIDWHTVLNNHGFKALGYGSFGVVWENPKLPYVLKVFSASDSAYIDWISVARQNKNNPHMPRFVSARLLKITPEVLAIRMEKLFPVINQEKNVVFESDLLLQERYNPSEQIKSVGFDTDQRNLRYYCQTHPTWLPALDIVKNFSNNSGYRLDFHNKNVMVRDNDILVITDPVYGREDLVGR